MEYTLDHILNWVNLTRQAFALGDPLDQLPAGRRTCGESCVIANALGDGVRATNLHAYLDRTDTTIYFPSFVREFVVDFDQGRWPELDVDA